METRRRPHVDDAQRWTFRVSDICARTGISESEVRRAIYAGELPAWKYRGRLWLIDARDALAWIEGTRDRTAA